MKKRLPASIKLTILHIMTCAIALVLLPMSCSCNCSCGNEVPTGGWKPYAGRIAFIRQGDGGIELCVMNSNGSKLTTLTDDIADDFSYAWSPDGTKIAYTADDEHIYAMDADGSNKVQLSSDTSENKAPVWSPDGSKIAFLGGTDNFWTATEEGDDGSVTVFGFYSHCLYMVNADGSGQINLTSHFGSGSMKKPTWSPDGNKLALMYDRGSGSAHDICIVNADGSNWTALTNDTADNNSPAWSPDGTKIAFCSYANFNWGIYVINADGSDQFIPTELAGNNEEPTSYFDPSWSPNGAKIAHVAHQITGDDYEIYVMDADGSNKVQLTESEAQNRTTIWSTDGSKISFVSDRDGNWEIYMMNADGTDQTNMTNTPEDERYPVWVW